MFLFLIKKAFFDGWDNLFRLAFLNLGFIASLAIPLLLPGLFPTLPVLQMIIIAVGMFWCCVYMAASVLSLRTISDYHYFGFADFFRNIKEGWKAGLVYGVFSFLVTLVTTTALPFYLQINSLFGVLFAAIIFWTLVAASFTMQFFLPVYGRLDRHLLKALKKSFIIFLDNPLFSNFWMIFSGILLIISAILALLMPGIAGIMLFMDEALRLRLLKYDWLDEHPEIANDRAARRRIPWDALLIDEREKTGTRTLKNFIFPWKD
jgi:hypothetical protein